MASDDQEIVADTPLPEDKFYRGSILRLSAGRQTGVVRTRAGRDIPFTFQFVTMMGERRRFEDLHIGTVVGFDVSWTANGLRISAMKILDESLYVPVSSGQSAATHDDPPTAGGTSETE